MAPVSSFTRQPACHLPAGERDRAQPCWIRHCGALTGLDHVAATPADTALRAPPTSKTLHILPADSALEDRQVKVSRTAPILAIPVRSPSPWLGKV
jgi:hypothetical protein